MTRESAPARSATESDFARLRAFVDEQRRNQCDRLPAEQHLSDTLAISRARLRVMLKKLEKEGLIWRHVGKGTFIGERSLTNDLDAMPELLTPPEAFEARLVIEPQLAGIAARRATPAQIAEMRACLDRMGQLDNFDQWALWDERLHRMFAKAAGNTLLLAVYDTVRESAPSGMRNLIDRVFSSGTRQESNREHAIVVDAIADHDPVAAETAIRKHLLAVRQGLFGLI